MYGVSGQPAAGGNTVRRQITPVVPGSFLSAASFNKLGYLSGAVQQADGRMLGRVDVKKKKNGRDKNGRGQMLDLFESTRGRLALQIKNSSRP